MIPHNRDNPVSLKDSTYCCGGKWIVIPTTVGERMGLRIGRHWIARCDVCGLVSVCKTFKQEQEKKAG
jgi:hypothetical protein